MKIGVLIKQVPDTETRIKLAAGGKGIDESGIKWVVNPYDEFAIEAALQLKQAAQAEVVVFAAGPARVVDDRVHHDRATRCVGVVAEVLRVYL